MPRMLRWQRYEDLLGARGLVLVTWEPWDDEDPKPTLAGCGYGLVAALLAEPLRRAFHQHLDEHRCWARGGFAHCEEAMRLFRLLPRAEQVTIG
jgi:hypothetical protein